MIGRRTFMAAILGTAIAPAVVRAASLMPVRVLESGIVVMTLSNCVVMRDVLRCEIETIRSARHDLGTGVSYRIARGGLHVGDVLRVKGLNAVVLSMSGTV